MRGSPLLRTLLVIAALAGAALGIRALSNPTPAQPQAPPAPAPTTEDAVQVPFFVSCSEVPAEVSIEAGGAVVSLEPDSAESGGMLKLSGDHPTIFITIRWAKPSDLPRFAKLTLEPAGHPTLRRTFDAIGDIEDVWELHLHP
ncbi:hypothetical protein [Haloferula helveola]|uniref:hypothetical protein n=1 Tax=Haloferula helveola TaxID=490095 RepID=UPI0030CAD55C